MGRGGGLDSAGMGISHHTGCGRWKRQEAAHAWARVGVGGHPLQEHHRRLLKDTPGSLTIGKYAKTRIAQKLAIDV